MSPITKSAKKALRQNVKRRLKNLRKKRKIKELQKKFRVLVSENKKRDAQKLLPEFYKTVDKAVKTGVIKANKAARLKSKTTKLLNPNVQKSSGS